MAFRLYAPFVEDVLSAMFKGRSALSGSRVCWQTVQLSFVPLRAGYTYDPSHDDGSSHWGSAIITELQVYLDSTDPAIVKFDRGVLWVDPEAIDLGVFPSDLDDIVGIGLMVVHSDGATYKWQRLVGYWDTFQGSPFEVLNGESAVVRLPKHHVSVFDFFGCATATAGLYPRAVEEALSAILGGTTRTTLEASHGVEVDFLNSNSRYCWAHFNASDPDQLPYDEANPANNWWAQTGTPSYSSAVLAGVTVSRSGAQVWVDATDEVVSAVYGDSVATALVSFISGGALHGFLLLYAPLDEGIPLVGQNVTLQWASAFPYLFGLEV